MKPLLLILTLFVLTACTQAPAPDDILTASEEVLEPRDLIDVESQAEPDTAQVQDTDADADAANHDHTESGDAGDANHIGCAAPEISESGCAMADPEHNNLGILAQFRKDVPLEMEMATYGDENEFSGYYVRPTDGSWPGVVMIHEWWGLNDNIKAMAELLATQGYAVLAVDLYNGQVAKDSAEAGKFAGEARENPENMVKHMRAAVSYLRAQPNVEADRIGSMGWCFGGAQSLQLALSGEPMSATVIYYGSLTEDQNALSAISWPVLGIFGETDGGIPPEEVHAFESAMDAVGVANEIHIYPRVGHAFANPSGQNYAADETLDAWGKTLEFLDETLKS